MFCQIVNIFVPITDDSKKVLNCFIKIILSNDSEWDQAPPEHCHKRNRLTGTVAEMAHLKALPGPGRGPTAITRCNGTVHCTTIMNTHLEANGLQI